MADDGMVRDEFGIGYYPPGSEGYKRLMTNEGFAELEEIWKKHAARAAERIWEFAECTPFPNGLNDLLKDKGE